MDHQLNTSSSYSKTPYNYMSNQTAPKSRVLLEKQIDWQLIVVLAKKFSQFTKKIQQDATVYQNFISYLYETNMFGATRCPSSGA
jgi:hypothetical protein